MAARGFLWWLPDPPKAPDYSTPEAVTTRAQEAAWDGGCPEGTHSRKSSVCLWPKHVKMLRVMKASVKSDGAVYKDFARACRNARAILNYAEPEA